MQRYSLPEEIRGEWIWSKSGLDALESYIFFRKDFTLSETPSTAEIWITARTFFHLYINGRHLTWGPPPGTARDSYVMYLDIGFLLQTGPNVIAVLAHNSKIMRYSMRRQAPGLWCQVNINGTPKIASDRTWMILDGSCFHGARPRRSRSLGFTEKMDLGEFPAGWEEMGYNTVRWRHPDHRVSLDAARGDLIPLAASEMISRRSEFPKLALRGRCAPVCTAAWVCFDSVVQAHGPGVYAAEAYVYSAQETEVEFELYCNDPYHLFVNNRSVKSQSLVPLETGKPLDLCVPPCFGQGELADVSGLMEWRTGWNHILLIKQCEPGGCGATLLFPGISAGEVRLVRGQRKEATAGWMLSGPLQAPLANVTGSINLAHLEKSPYLLRVGDPVNDGALLMSYGFEGNAGGSSPPDTIELRQNEYVILDAGQTVLGCPQFTFSGPDAAVVNVVCGENIVDDQVVACGDDGRNNTDTLLLGPKPVEWTAYAPRGFRYVMIVARRVPGNDTVQITAPGFLVREYPHQSPGEFRCSDQLLTEIWETGRRTLLATATDQFIDSPSKDCAQYIPDAMIQSWAAYHVFGAFHLAAKSLAEFADSQFETGEMPALAPSDIYQNTPDYALLWPVWLQRHYLYTGDLQFLKQMEPALRRLFSYFSYIAKQDILANLDTRYGAYCFLDHGEMDREGIVTGLNALYCRSLLAGSWILDQLEDSRGAGILRRRAAHVAHAIRQLCWDEERMLFADGWHDGRMSEFYSWQTNVLAMYGGLVDEALCQEIFDRLFQNDPPLEPLADPESNNPYIQYFVLQVAFALGRQDWAFRLIRWYWGGMVERGARTWWEFFDPQANDIRPNGVSFCQGYAAAPNAFLPTELVGIRPAAPGFTRVYFNPYLKVVQQVQAQIPTPYGRITVHWRIKENGELECSIDANYPLEVVPMLDPAIADSATLRVSDDVAILAAEIPTETGPEEDSPEEE